MKKTLFPCFVIFMLILTISTISYSQGRNSISNPDTSHEEKDSGYAFINDFNIRAVRSFTRNFENTSEIKWIKLDKGYSIVYFMMDSIKTSVLYNQKGEPEWMKRDYTEDKLPREVRHIVKSTYYDFSIHSVNEFTVNQTTAYIITLMDKISLIIINVIDGEMEVIKKYKKG